MADIEEGIIVERRRRRKRKRKVEAYIMFIQQGEWYSYYATLFFITVLPLTVMSIAAYVVLGENWEATCGGKMMPLQS